MNTSKQNFAFSVVIPVYNEETSIQAVVEQLRHYLNAKNYSYEIIIVNDGSTDQSENRLKVIKDTKLITHPYNKGYGAALKTGVANAQFDWVLFYDGDGQHQPEFIDDLIKNSSDYDMVVGARVGYQRPLIRQPGLKVIHWLANYLAQHKIPDLNSGFRLIKKESFNKFAHLLPNGFSLSSTITLAFFREGLNIRYIPIRIQKRIGKSKVSPRDGLTSIMLIVRLITLFSPLRIFLPVAFVLGFLAAISLIRNIIKSNISDVTILLFLSAIMVFFFGLLADQIAAIRREIKN